MLSVIFDDRMQVINVKTRAMTSDELASAYQSVCIGQLSMVPGAMDKVCSASCICKFSFRCIITWHVNSNKYEKGETKWPW